ncbi:MAG: hydrogenase maturation protease [Terracidiphilus sp.]
MAERRTIVIDPVTRIEGHSKITLHLNDEGKVEDARFHVTQFRGFEKFCEGRPFAEMPSLMARICGIDARSPMAPRILIVAYGNPLRSDDGIAWHAAELLRREFPAPSTEIFCVHQLTPEVAEDASRADDLIFIDAACDGEPGQIVVAEIGSSGQPAKSSHHLTPQQVIALCRQLYGVSPRAFTISIAGKSFEHGDALTDTLEAALPRLIGTVGELIDSLNPRRSSLQET